MSDKINKPADTLAQFSLVVGWFVLVSGLLFCLFELIFVGVAQSILVVLPVAFGSMLISLLLMLGSKMVRSLRQIEDRLDRITQQ